MSGPRTSSQRADDRLLLVRALLTAAAVQCESDANPATTRSLLFNAAPAFNATIHRPSGPEDDCVQLRVSAPRITNRIYLTLTADLEGINVARLRGRVRADSRLRLLTAAGTVMLVIAIGLIAAAVHTVISGHGDVDVAVFNLLWATFIVVAWTLWMRSLVMAAAAVRGLLQQAFTSVTFAPRDRRRHGEGTASRPPSTPGALRERWPHRGSMEPRDSDASERGRQGIGRYTDVPLWLMLLSVASMLAVVAVLVIIAGELQAPWLGLPVAAILFVALSTGLRRIARFHVRSRSNGS